MAHPNQITQGLTIWLTIFRSDMKNDVDDLTIDMFGGKPFTGLEIGHAMAKVAADHAGDEWKDAAFESFKQFARMNYEFTTEQVRAASLHLPPPPDKRAWGFIAKKASKEGIVSAVGPVRAESKTVHGMYVTLWRSNVNK